MTTQSWLGEVGSWKQYFSCSGVWSHLKLRGWSSSRGVFLGGSIWPRRMLLGQLRRLTCFEHDELSFKLRYTKFCKSNTTWEVGIFKGYLLNNRRKLRDDFWRFFTVFEEATGAVFAYSLYVIFAQNTRDMNVIEFAWITKLTMGSRKCGAERDGRLFCFRCRSLRERLKSFRSWLWVVKHCVWSQGGPTKG